MKMKKRKEKKREMRKENSFFSLLKRMKNNLWMDKKMMMT